MALDLEPRRVDLDRVYRALRARCITPAALNEIGDYLADAVLAGFVPPAVAREAIGALVKADPDKLFPRLLEADAARAA